MEEEREFQEQRVLMKFLVKARKRNVEIYEMMTGVYGDCLVKTSSFFKWVGRCRERTKKAKMSKSKIKTLLMIFSILVELSFKNGSLNVRLLILLTTWTS